MLAAYIILSLFVFIVVAALVKNHLENKANNGARDKKVRKFGIFPWS